MKALVLNDTRNGKHLGCILVMQQLESLCHEVGIEISAMLRLGLDFRARAAVEISRCDVVIINGEGTMHHDAAAAKAIMEAALIAADLGRPVALINTVWQGNKQTNLLLSKCNWISVRESLSRESIEQAGYAAKVVPDLLLSSRTERLFLKTNTHAGVIVMDDVRWELSLALARYASVRHLPFYPMGARPSLSTRKGWEMYLKLGWASNWASQFHMGQVSAVRDASLVLTGRFHGICLAILSQRPFVAFASNTHKIEGLLKDAGLGGGGLLFDDPPSDPAQCHSYIDQAIATVMDHMALGDNRHAYEKACAEFSARARSDAISMFEDIRALRSFSDKAQIKFTTTIYSREALQKSSQRLT